MSPWIFQGRIIPTPFDISQKSLVSLGLYVHFLNLWIDHLLSFFSLYVYISVFPFLRSTTGTSNWRLNLCPLLSQIHSLWPYCNISSYSKLKINMLAYLIKNVNQLITMQCLATLKCIFQMNKMWAPIPLLKKEIVTIM